MNTVIKTALEDEDQNTAGTGPQDSSLQSYFRPDAAADDLEQVFLLKQAQPVLQAFTALFHGGFNAVLVRLLVLRELVADATMSTLTRADINLKLSYLDADSLETVLARLRSHDLLAWDSTLGVYRVTPLARNVLAALDGLLAGATVDDEAEMGFILSQVAGSQAVGGVTVAQLHHLLGRLIELTDEFRDAIASGSEFQLRAAQAKWHSACDWVEKGSVIMHAITNDANADAATHRAAQAIGRAQSTLLNMQGMFSRSLNQIERQRVHLGQSGLSTTDIKTWLLGHENLADLAIGALASSVRPLFITPAEMIDVAETELLADRALANAGELPSGIDAPVSVSDEVPTSVALDAWLAELTAIAQTPDSEALAKSPAIPVAKALLPASFAIASYRASLLPLLGDESESALKGGTATMARLALVFTPKDTMHKLSDPFVKAMSGGTLTQQRHAASAQEPSMSLGATAPADPQQEPERPADRKADHE
ncbi:MAG: hypothetical protein ACRYGK_09790 [Janthinobacterium lividum]